MADRPVYGPMFGGGQALPRGPHQLSREEVASSQRERLMESIAATVAEKGYGAATITEISRRAKVSPKAFYEHFSDKLDCYLAAYATFTTVLLGRLADALEPVGDWHEFVRTALDAYLISLEEDPSAARAFLVEIEAAGRDARSRRRASYSAFAAPIRARHELMREQHPELGPLPDRVYLGIVHGVRELAADTLEDDQRPRLRTLAPDMIYWIDAIVAGAAHAAGARADAVR